MCGLMTSAAEDNGLLGDEQFGFRKGRSTIDAAFVLTTLIKKAKAKAFHKPTKEHGNKSYRKKKKKGVDPFPGKKPVDPEALER